MNDLTNTYPVPISKPDSHPIIIGVAFNPVMKRHDLTIQVGNFANDKEAREYAKRVKEFLERDANGTFQSVQ